MIRGETVALTFDDDHVSSDVTPHFADRLEDDAWVVSWQPDRQMTRAQAAAAIELAQIVAKGRDGGPDTTNYAYFTWERVKELAEVLRVIPLKTVLYLESLAQDAEGPERSDPKESQ